MPKPSTHKTPTTLTEEEGVRLQSAADRKLAELAELLGLTERTVDDAALRRTNREFGKQLSPIAQAAADTCGKGGQTFHGLPCTEATLRARDVRVRLLGSVKEAVDHFSARLGQNLLCDRVDLADDVRLVVRCADATEALPTTPAPVSTRVALAARPLRALLQGRQDEARASYVATRATNRDAAATLAGKDDEVSSLRADNGRLAVENRFLAGEALRSTDLGAAPPADRAAPAPAVPARGVTAPAAPRAARRAPRRRSPR